MSFIAGIDFSTMALDIVLLSENDDTAQHHRRRLDTGPGDALARIRRIPDAMPRRGAWQDDILAVAIEEPFSRGKGNAYVMQLELGAIITCLPARVPLALIRADDWRKHCGLPLRCGRLAHKQNAIRFALDHWEDGPERIDDNTADSFCIAWAGRELQRAADQQAA